MAKVEFGRASRGDEVLLRGRVGTRVFCAAMVESCCERRERLEWEETYAGRM